MSCRDCNKLPSVKGVTWMRFGDAVVGIYACPGHARSVTQALETMQRGIDLEQFHKGRMAQEEDDDSEEDGEAHGPGGA